jgi:hypothetical protein
LRELSRVGITVENRSLISTRMGIVARDARFAAVAEFAPRFADLDGLALAAAAAFALSGDFTALHVMTATHAMRILAPHLPDRDRAMQGFWPAFAAAGIVAGTPPTLDPFVLNALRDEAPQAWEPLLEEAVRQDDEHVIKATYTAWRLDMDLPDPVFRAAANRYLLKKSTRPSQAR